MSQMRDSQTNPPPVGSGNVWAYCAPLNTRAITCARDVREAPTIFPQWRPLNRPDRA